MKELTQSTAEVVYLSKKTPLLIFLGLLLAVLLFSCESNSINSGGDWVQCSKIEVINGQVIQCGWLAQLPQTRCERHR